MAKANSANAKRVLTALIDGVHPETGAELKNESILQSVGVLRCLMTARDALATVEARELRRAQLPSGVGKTWTDEEEQQLVTQFQAGEPLENIAHSHSRTVRAIEARLERMGLITASQRVTNNNFFGASTLKLQDSGTDHD
jgi:hypothetical protein